VCVCVCIILLFYYITAGVVMCSTNQLRLHFNWSDIINRRPFMELNRFKKCVDHADEGKRRW